MVSGIQPGHFTWSVEIVRELSSLGHNVTCDVLDEYEERIKDVGAKVVAYKIDRNDFKKLIPPDVPPFYAYILIFCEAIISSLSKDETKYDYYIFDSFFDIIELNKIFKIPLDKYALIYTNLIFSIHLYNIFNDKILYLSIDKENQNIILNTFFNK